MSDFCLACTYADDYAYHRDDCTTGRAIDGAYWLGMLGFALAAPAATERAAEVADEYERNYGAAVGIARRIRWWDGGPAG